MGKTDTKEGKWLMTTIYRMRRRFEIPKYQFGSYPAVLEIPVYAWMSHAQATIEDG